MVPFEFVFLDRYSFIENRIQFYKLTEYLTAEGGRGPCIPDFAGSSHQEARKRGAKQEVKEPDLQSLKKLYAGVQNAQKQSTLTPEEEERVRGNVAMLLKQLGNVNSNVAERKKRSPSLRSLFKQARRNSEVLYHFTVGKLVFETEDPSMNDLSFRDYEEFQQFVLETTIQKTETLEMTEEEEEAQEVVHLQMDVAVVSFTYEVDSKLSLHGSILTLRGETIHPVAGK